MPRRMPAAFRYRRNSRPNYDVAAALVLEPATWIHRRVETLHFLGDGATRRSVSVDASVPREFYQLGCLPVAILNKGTLHALDVRDASGAALSVMNTMEDADLASRLLNSLLIADPTDDHGELLTDVVFFSGTDETRDELLDAVARRAQPDDIERAVFLAQSLMAGFLFVILLPEEFEQGQRLLVKYSYEEPVSIDGHWFPKPIWTRVTPSWSERYHFEVRAPRPLLVGNLELRSELGEDGKETLVTGHAGPEGLRVAHVAMDCPDNEEDFRAWCVLLAERRGVVTVALWTTFATWLLLATPAVANWLYPETIRVPTDGTSAALLLLVPALLAAFLAQPSDHEVVGHRIRGARLQLVGSGGLLFAAALVLSGAVQDEWRAPAWYLLAVLATAVLVFAFVWRTKATVRPRVSNIR